MRAEVPLEIDEERCQFMSCLSLLPKKLIL